MKLVLVAIAVSCASIASPARSQDRPAPFTAISADTIKSPAGVRYRLLGYSAPETALAQCAAELNAATAAKRRLQELIDTGAVRLVVVGGRDARGRGLATLYVDVAVILIAENLARTPVLGGQRHDWCKAPVR